MDYLHASPPDRPVTRESVRPCYDYDRVPAMHRERAARYAEYLTDFRLTASLNLDALERALRLCARALVFPEFPPFPEFPVLPDATEFPTFPELPEVE